MSTGCGKCHECGDELLKSTCGDCRGLLTWCPTCQLDRRYKSHGFQVGRWDTHENSRCPQASAVENLVSSALNEAKKVYSYEYSEDPNPEIEPGDKVTVTWIESKKTGQGTVQSKGKFGGKIFYVIVDFGDDNVLQFEAGLDNYWYSINFPTDPVEICRSEY